MIFADDKKDAMRLLTVILAIIIFFFFYKNSLIDIIYLSFSTGFIYLSDINMLKINENVK